LCGPAGDEALLTFDFVESQLQGVQLVTERREAVVLDRAKASVSRGEFGLDSAQRAFRDGMVGRRIHRANVSVA
jgi:hypothetical protein